MNPFYIFILMVFLLWVFIKTLSYGKWTWNKKNKMGAIAIVIIAIAELFLPIWSLFIMK